MLKRIALVAMIGLALGACSTINAMKSAIETGVATSITQKQTLLAIDAFDTVQITGTNYLRLQRCPGSAPPICRDPALTPQIEAALRSGRASRNNLKAYLRAHLADGENGTVTAVADFNLITAATNTIESLTAAYRAAVAVKVGS